MRNLQITQLITNRENQSVELYFSEIGKEQIIMAEEEVFLAQKIRLGDQAALEKLTKANLRFVVSVAKKYQYRGLPLSDLINEGNLGLIKAAQRFDETKGFKFISFAVWWIRQSIIAAINENARIVRLPVNKIGEITRINKALSEVEKHILREPTDEQIADHLDMNVEQVKEALSCAPWASSLDMPLSGEDGFSLLDRLAGDFPETDHYLIAESCQVEIDGLLSTLSERERRIIELSYGITGGREMSPADIAGVIGMSSESIRQIRNKALEKLRDTKSIIL